MTFIELLKKHEIKHLWYILSSHHNLPPIRVERLLSLYEQARAEMLTLVDNDIPKGVLTCELVVEDVKNGVPENYFDCVILENSEVYAFELTEWAELVGCEVDNDCLQKYGELIVTAELLYEMTFCGFSRASIQKEIDELHESINEIDHKNDEGRPIEELFAKLEKEREERKNSEEEKAFKEWFVNAPKEVRQRVFEKIKAEFFEPKQHEKATDEDVINLLNNMVSESKYVYKGCDSAESLLCDLFDGIDCDALLYLLTTLWQGKGT